MSLSGPSCCHEQEWGAGLSGGEGKLSCNAAEFIGALKATEGWAPV